MKTIENVSIFLGLQCFSAPRTMGLNVEDSGEDRKQQRLLEILGHEEKTLIFVNTKKGLGERHETTRFGQL